MLGPVVGSLSQPVWGYKGDKGNLEWPHPQLARAKWAWRASPLPLSLGGGIQETASGQAGEENQGQATGVFTAAAGTFHPSLRGAVQRFQSPLVTPVNSGVRPRSILSSYGRLMGHNRADPFIFNEGHRWNDTSQAKNKEDSSCKTRHVGRESGFPVAKRFASEKQTRQREKVSHRLNVCPFNDPKPTVGLTIVH